jgi:mercuric ion transport protein
MPDGWQKYRKSCIAAAVGTAVVALCCFTPLLVIVLGLVGVSFLTPYLDYVLLPALAVLLVVTVVSYLKWKQSHHHPL